jgi:hypothetical protein
MNSIKKYSDSYEVELILFEEVVDIFYDITSGICLFER